MRRIKHMVRAVALFLIILMLAIPVFAATDLGLNVNGVTAETANQKSSGLTTYGDGSWTNVDGVLYGTATGKGGIFSSYTGKATLTFSIPKAGTFSFRYKDITLNEGSLKTDGTNVSTDSFTKEFTEAGTVTVVIESAKGAGKTTTATIYDISFLTAGATGITFKAVPGVDYTVNGISITEETGDQVVSISTETVSVTANYDDSTQIIREWKAADGSAYSFAESGFAKPSEAITLTPVLGPRGTPQFTVNGARYYTWEGAFTGISNTTVTVTQSGTLPAGNYAVPAGITLLVPFDTAGTCYTTTPADNNNIPWEEPTPYRTLTMAPGAHLTINGAMSLSAKHHTGQALQNCGLTTGKYGHVDMGENSTITVNSGGVLYAWGYITGSGSVTVKSGAKCYEYFVIQDFKDGNSLSDLSSNKGKRVFMLNNYYVQNVVVPMTIEAGGYLNGYSSFFFQTLKVSKHAPVPFLTPGGENGLFKLSTGTIIKRYDYATDRMYIEIDGTVEMGNISITGSTGLIDITIDSKDYDMTIGSNITLMLKPGAQMNLSTQSLVMIPGSELYIDEGASLNIRDGQRFVIHDIDQWQKNYSYNARVWPLAFVPNRTYKFQDSDLKDPLIVVNGTVDASGGYLYVTAGGGNIYSTNSGVVKFPAYSESTNSQYMRQGQTFDDYPITPAWLKNEGGSFTKHTVNTAEDYYYSSEHGKWVKDGHTFTDNVTAPTCTEKGYTTHTCACGYVYTDTEVAALGHKSAGDDGDCTTAITCAVCGEVTTAAAKAHTEEVYEEAVLPTYEEAGTSAGKKCSVCKTITAEPKPIEVAEVNGEKYTILSEAIEAAGDGGTVTLKESISDTIKINDTYPVDKVTIVNDGGYTAPIIIGAGYEQAQNGNSVTVRKMITLDAFSLDIEGEILLNLKFQLPDWFLNDENAYVQVTEQYFGINEAEDRDWKISAAALAELTSGQTVTSWTFGSDTETGRVELDTSDRYVFSQGIAAGEMSGDVTVRFFDGEDTLAVYEPSQDGIEPMAETDQGEGVTRSVLDYAELAIAKAAEITETEGLTPEQEKVKALGDMCEAMITFGHYAQIFYGDRCVGKDEDYQLITDNLGNSYEFMSIEGVTTDDVRSSITGFSGLQTTLPSSGVLLNMDSQIDVLVYFDDLQQNHLFQISHADSSMDVTLSNGFVKIGNVPPAYWNDVYTLSTDIESVPHTTLVSVYQWIMACLESAEDAEKNMAKAMFNYCQYAEGYFAARDAYKAWLTTNTQS